MSIKVTNEILYIFYIKPLSSSVYFTTHISHGQCHMWPVAVDLDSAIRVSSHRHFDWLKLCRSCSTKGL